MPGIFLEQAAPGMRLARPVANPQGVVICGAGMELTFLILDRLKEMGIRRIVVEEGAPGLPPPLSPEAHQALVEERFARVAGDPILDALKRHLLLRGPR